MPQGGMAGAEQRLCSGGTTGRGVLGLGAAIVWGDGIPGATRVVKRGRAGDLGGRASKESSPEISARWMRALRGVEGAGGRGL